ncbi:MAG: hypothetical protein ACM34J_12750 [Ignavibacteria bacterium]
MLGINSEYRLIVDGYIDIKLKEEGEKLIEPAKLNLNGYINFVNTKIEQKNKNELEFNYVYIYPIPLYHNYWRRKLWNKTLMNYSFCS